MTVYILENINIGSGVPLETIRFFVCGCVFFYLLLLFLSFFDLFCFGLFVCLLLFLFMF